MPTKKPPRKRSTHKRTIKDSRGISPAISTIIISGTLLVILVITSFVSGNVLELQIASTEFEQGKTNMMLLDEVIQDVALRRGAGGYVQFNQRSGGIGITENTEKIKIRAFLYPITNMNFTSNANGWATTTIIVSGTPTYGYDSADGNPSGAGSHYHRGTGTSAKVADITFTTETSFNFTYTYEPPVSVHLSYAYKLSGTSIAATGNSLTVKLVKPDLTTADLDTVSFTGTAAWTYKNDIAVSNTHFTQNGTYKLQVVNRILTADDGKTNYAQLNFDDIGLRIQLDTIYESPNLMSLVYRGGSKVSGTDVTLRGTDSLNVSMTNTLSHLRIETGSGVQIKLDYNRVRIVNGTEIVVGDILHSFIEITFIRLVMGKMGGSGTVNVKVQNIKINTFTRTYDTPERSIILQIKREDKDSGPLPFPVATKTVVIFTEISVQVSTIQG